LTARYTAESGEQQQSKNKNGRANRSQAENQHTLEEMGWNKVLAGETNESKTENQGRTEARGQIQDQEHTEEIESRVRNEYLQTGGMSAARQYCRCDRCNTKIVDLAGAHEQQISDLEKEQGQKTRGTTEIQKPIFHSLTFRIDS
jgi:hypothetical protein